MRNSAFLGVFIGALFFLCGSVPSASAAALYIDPAISELHSGDSITLSVRLDVNEEVHECVNAVSAEISYPSNIEPIDVSIGDSIFSMWVEQPTINRENHTITFAGGIPNGYCGRVVGDPRLTNTLAKIIFMVPGFMIGGSGGDTAKIDFTEQNVAYLNDGYGTTVALSGYPATISINKKPGATIQNPWQTEVAADTIPPEEFSVTLQKDEKAFSQKYYIVFNTTDKQTGVDHYEVIEEPTSQFGAFQWGRADAPWIVARSPYVLKDQSLNSIVRVKAVDKAGNEYIANLIPESSLRTMSIGQMISIAVAASVLLLLVLSLFVTVIVIKRRRKNKVAVVDTNQTTEFSAPNSENSHE